MSEAFDPYRKWLGIPPAEQPPNHYRLLGIAMFEDDPDVVTHAADRQMAHLRTFQGGKYRDQSQKILNEVSAARVCLLNSEKKAKYDSQLKRELAPPVSPAASPPVAPPPPTGPPLPPGSELTPPPTTRPAPASVPQGKAVAVGVPAGDSAPVVRTSSRPRSTSYARGRKKSSPLPIVLVALGVAVVGIGAILFVMASQKTKTYTEERESSNSASLDPARLKSTPPQSPPTNRTEPPRETPPTRVEPTVTPLPESSTGDFTLPENSPPLGNPLSIEEINAQSVETALTEARQKLNDRQARQAKQLLENSREEAKSVDKDAAVVHLIVLAGYVEDFLAGVRSGMRNKLEPGESYEFRGDSVELVSVNEDTGEVTYKFNGTEATHKPEEVPTKPAIVLAWKSLEREEIDPFSYVLTAAFLRFDANSSMPEQERLELAKEYWNEGKEAGVTDSYVAQELGIAVE